FTIVFISLLCIIGLSPIWIPFAGFFISFKIMGTFQTSVNPPEMLQTLLAYEKKPGQAQKFLACMGKNFRWPSSMPEYLRRSAFENIADVEFEFDNEVGYNLLFFYNALDKSEFAGHESEWVTIHKQRVIEYRQRYDDDKLNYILETMPGTVQVPVDQTRLSCNPPAKMVIVQRTDNGDDYKVEHALIGNDVTDQLAYVHEPGNPLKFLDV
ncbi:35712_t:CDS:2, partial [Racocetra persica]